MGYIPFDNRLLKPQSTMINSKNGFKWLSLIAAFMFGIILGGLIATIMMSTYNKLPFGYTTSIKNNSHVDNDIGKIVSDASNIFVTLEEDALNITDYVDDYFYPAVEKLEEVTDDFEDFNNYDPRYHKNDILTIIAKPQIKELKLNSFSELNNQVNNIKTRTRRSPLFVMSDEKVERNEDTPVSSKTASNFRIKRTSKKRDGVDERDAWNRQTPRPDNIANTIYGGKRRRKRDHKLLLLPLSHPKHLTMYVERETGKITSIEHQLDPFYINDGKLQRKRIKRAVSKEPHRIANLRRLSSSNQIKSKPKKRASKQVYKRFEDQIKKSNLRHNTVSNRGLRPRPLSAHTKAHKPNKPMLKAVKKREHKPIRLNRRLPGKGTVRRARKPLLGSRGQRGAKARSLYGLAIDLSRKKHDHFYGFRSLLKNRYKYGYPKTMDPMKKTSTAKYVASSTTTKGFTSFVLPEITSKLAQTIEPIKHPKYGSGVIKAAGVVAGLAGVVAGLALGKEINSTRDTSNYNVIQQGTLPVGLTSLDESIKNIPFTKMPDTSVNNSTENSPPNTSNMFNINIASINTNSTREMNKGLDSSSTYVFKVSNVQAMNNTTYSESTKSIYKLDATGDSGTYNYISDATQKDFIDNSVSHTSAQDSYASTTISTTPTFPVDYNQEDLFKTKGTPTLNYRQTTATRALSSTDYGIEPEMTTIAFVPTFSSTKGMDHIDSSYTPGSVSDITYVKETTFSSSGEQFSYSSLDRGYSISSYAPLTGTNDYYEIAHSQTTQYDKNYRRPSTFINQDNTPSTITTMDIHSSDIATYDKFTHSDATQSMSPNVFSTSPEETISFSSSISTLFTSEYNNQESSTMSGISNTQPFANSFSTETNVILKSEYNSANYNYESFSPNVLTNTITSSSIQEMQSVPYSTQTSSILSFSDSKVTSKLHSSDFDEKHTFNPIFSDEKTLNELEKSSFYSPTSRETDSEHDYSTETSTSMMSSQSNTQTLSELYSSNSNFNEISTHISPDSTPGKLFDDSEHRKDNIPYYQTAEAYYFSSKDSPRYSKTTTSSSYDNNPYNYHYDLSFLDKRKDFSRGEFHNGHYNYNFETSTVSSDIGTSYSSAQRNPKATYEQYDNTPNYLESSQDFNLNHNLHTHPSLLDAHTFNDPNNVLQATSPYLYYPGKDPGDAAKENSDPEVFLKLNNAKLEKKYGKDFLSSNVNFNGRNLQSSNSKTRYHPGLLTLPDNEGVEEDYPDFTIDPDEFDEDQRRDIKALSNIDIPEYLEVTTTKKEMLEIQRCHCKSFSPEDSGVYYQCRYDPTRSKRTLMAMDCHLSELPAEILFPKDCSKKNA